MVTWDPLQCHVTPVPKPTAPDAQEQWAVARAYCVALGDQGCLTNGAPNSMPGCTVDEGVESCISQLLWFHQNDAAECEDVWRKDIACGAKSSFVAPFCNGADTFGPTFGSTEACATENVALLDCEQQHSADVEVAGSYTTCYYQSKAVTATACDVNCQVGQHSVQLDCSGPEGLPKQCGCAINGFGLPGLQPIFVNSCAEAAQQAADGLCTGKLDCCFEYLDRDKQACLCVEPAEFGYASCEAMMAVGHGQRVDICPGLLPSWRGDRLLAARWLPAVTLAKCAAASLRRASSATENVRQYVHRAVVSPARVARRRRRRETIEAEHESSQPARSPP